MTRQRAVVAASMLVLLTAIATALAQERTVEFSGPRSPVDPGCESTDCLDSARCVGCHRAIYNTWAASLHRQSWSDPVFQESYAIEPRASCRHCHAPLAPAAEVPAGLVADQGISCVVCHVREGVIFGSRPSEHAPHEVHVDPTMTASQYCAGCHQFDFPVHHADPPSGQLAMQNTFREWQESPAAQQGLSCQSCHMPEVHEQGDAYRSHAFVGSRDPELLRSSVEVTHRIHCDVDSAGVELEFELIAQNVGHAVPTGDLFRRLELRVVADDGIYESRRFLERRFVWRTRTWSRADSSAGLTLERRETSDSRLVPGQPSRFSFRLPATVREVDWSLDHLVMPTPDASSADRPRHRTQIHDGRIPVPDSCR